MEYNLVRLKQNPTKPKTRIQLNLKREYLSMSYEHPKMFFYIMW